ncbi:MAG: DUF5916 domain-containing protein [Gammaproteobacteria bacterium]|nr:DUF5916 domain-containing protein [Gammaproteobacteria bacterium]
MTLLLLPLSVAAEQSALAPSKPPVTQAYPLAVKPQLDGNVLGDPAWQGAKATTGFWQIRPDEGRPASQRTEVFVGFTDQALYIGVVCYDDDPGAIIVADSRRDSSLADTDSFQVMLDSFFDRQNGLVFGTNPAGIEYDGQVTKESVGSFSAGGGGFNLNWDTTWEVKASISDIGWSAEMAIPFKALRYGGKDAQVWGINFQRNIRRNNEIAFWSPLSRQHNLHRVSEAGSIEGIKVPPQRNLKITPYVLGTATRGGEVRGTDYDEEFGIDVKYSLTRSLTLDATYNTDFAQVEVDELQVNLNRFSLFFPEKRPFFLENAGQFSVGSPREVELFFSRRIGVGNDGTPVPIDAGLRLSGKIGNSTNVGLLHMRSEAVDGIAPRNDYSVVRVNQELPNRSSIGAIFVNRDGDGSLLGDDDDDYNRTYAVDGRWGIGDNTVISGYAARTDTPNLSGKDHALSMRADYSSAKWSNGIGYTEVGEDFNPEVGFLARDGYRKGDFRILRRYRPENWWGLHELRPHLVYRGFWDFDGFYESGFIHADNHWEWKNGIEIHTGVNITHEGVKTPFDIVDGVTVPADEYNHEEALLVLMSDEAAPLSASIRMTAGGLFGGDRVTVQPTVRYRIGESFSTELTWNYNDIDLPVPDGHFKINLARLRVSYSFTPKILLQALVQYDDRDDLIATNLRFSWLQSANAGLYLVYNEIDEDGLRKPRREILLKYSRIIDLLH